MVNQERMEAKDCRVTQETLNKVEHQTVPALHLIHQSFTGVFGDDEITIEGTRLPVWWGSLAERKCGEFILYNFLASKFIKWTGPEKL